MKIDEIRFAKEALQEEIDASEIYARLAKMYGGDVGERMKRLSEIEKMHAEFWRGFLEKRGVDVSRFRPRSLRLVLYSFLFRVMGLGLTLRLLESDESEAVEMYAEFLQSVEMSDEEREGLRRVLEDELIHEQELGSAGTRFEEFLSHIRDAVLGMNDGLVEVLSVTAGLSGVYGNSFYVALGGLIVGVAGALSMGVGAFISVKSQREVYEGVLRRVALATRYLGSVMRQRVEEHMVRKGFSRKAAEVVGREAERNPKLLSEIISEEEHGVGERDLERPGTAALYTGVFYMLGALIPILPYLLLQNIILSMVLSFTMAALALGSVGFVVAVSATISIRRKVAEMILSGLGSAIATFIIGKAASALIGVEVT